MVNSIDIYEKLGKVFETVKSLQQNDKEIKTAIKENSRKIDGNFEHFAKKIDKCNIDIVEIKTNLVNHLAHHNREVKIILAILGALAGIITLVIKFL